MNENKKTEWSEAVAEIKRLREEIEPQILYEENRLALELEEVFRQVMPAGQYLSGQEYTYPNSIIVKDDGSVFHESGQSGRWREPTENPRLFVKTAIAALKNEVEEYRKNLNDRLTSLEKALQPPTECTCD